MPEFDLDSTDTAVKISVVVATYATGDALDGVVAALDQQSLPADEFEVVWIDDGSPDDTFARLESFAATRPNYIVDRIENSGWPGRPRNTGVRKARGTYVFFMDHDDYIFPEALERMARFAQENDLDTVLAKEVVSGWARPSWASWRRQVPQLAEFDQATLQCITPHKLYRRAFLLEKDIWFPEGRIRLEDFDYNAQVWSQTDRIGVLADYPCYTWVIHPDNSHKAGFNVEVYWSSFVRSLQPILTHLEPGEKRDNLLVRWYRSRILERLGPGYAKYSEEYRETLHGIFADLLRYFPPEIDRLMTPSDRARSTLLRAQAYDALLALSRADAGLRLQSDATTTEWIDGRLRIAVTGVLNEDNETPMRFRHTEDGIVRVLPPEADGTGADTIDVREDLERAIGEIIVRARETHVDWILPSTSTLEVVPADAAGPDEVNVRFSIEGWLDPRNVAGGRPIDVDVWDVFYRIDGLGWPKSWWVPAGELDAPTAVIDGIAVVLYSTKSDNLAIDIAGKVKTLVGSAIPRLANATLEAGPDGANVTRIALPNTYAYGQTELHGTVTIDGRRVPAKVTGADGSAALVVQTEHLMSAHTVRARFGARPSAALFAYEFAALAAARDIVDGVAPGELADLLPYLPPTVDALLTPADRVRMALLRAGDYGGVTALNRADAAVRLQPRETTVAWVDGKLRIALSGVLSKRDGSPVRFARDGEAVVRVLPAKVDGADSVDVRAAVAAATGEVRLRGRTTRVDVVLPTTSTVTLTAGDSADELALEFTIESWLDPRVVADGQSMGTDVWDVTYRINGIGWAGATPIPAAGLDAPTALIAGVRMVLYSTKDKNLAIDSGDKIRTFVGSSVPRLVNNTIEPDEDGMKISYITLPNTYASGETQLNGWVNIDERQVPARLVGTDGAATLVIESASLLRARTVRAEFGGRASAPLFATELAAVRTAAQNRGVVAPIARRLRRRAVRVARKIKAKV
jgi:glycosyltransferase involved in cell wall biosynthesis